MKQKDVFPHNLHLNASAGNVLTPLPGRTAHSFAMRRLFEPFKRKEGYLETFCWGCAAPFNSPARTLPITTLGT